MFKFFRNIRQSLIMENKTSKYLKYAIGEIILVVIGILIALQINNWNEERKAIKAENILLHSVLQSLRSDSMVLANSQNEIKLINDLHKTLYLVIKGEQSPDSIENLQLVRRSLLFNPVTKANYPDLVNEVINQDLKNEIRFYYQKIDDMDQTANNLHDLIESRVRTFLAEKHVLNYGLFFEMDATSESFIKYDKFIPLLGNEDFQQLLFEVEIKIISVARQLDPLMEQNSKLINKITQYIK